ncbi:TPA: hypothetical protein N0F65_005566 [Lagenidium giganteum]|uniref:DUF962 domain-containing protein n=1 Tax=Lagenidium giganteum TaxID=4803 RepID=A0AAV2Z444_9STRA|nr:TPA: hypothetical protein N0F65_005566 [Lagenidium giganteum]
MGRISDRFNLEKQVVFYMSYHDNKMNQYIHFMCIWPILITAIVMLAGLDPLVEQPDIVKALPFHEYMILNPAAIVALVYMVWYVCLDWMAGTLGAALVFAGYLFANYFNQVSPATLGMPAWQPALAVHVTAWILQFIGHGVFERRKPALLDSLDQAVITAPMFVLLEALFPLGYRPQLYKRVMKQVKINVKNFHSSKTL